jgi:hypothetical protein
MLKGPDDAVPEFQPQSLEDRIKGNVQRNNFSIFCDMVTYLPADASVRSKDPIALGNRSLLVPEVLLKLPSALVLLADVVRRRSDDQLGSFIRDLSEKVQPVSVE